MNGPPAIEPISVNATEPPVRLLTEARRGVLLLLANLFLQLVINLTGPLWQKGPLVEDEKLILRTPSLEWYVLVVGNTLLTMLPGGLVLFRAARTRRWKTTSSVLLLALGIELAFVGGLCFYRPHNALLDTREPLRIRLFLYVLSGLHWLELWCVAVLLAEIFIWRRQQSFVERTEGLGYIIVAGFLSAMFWIAWTIASPPSVTDPDVLSFLLLLANDLVNLFAMFGAARLMLYAEGVLRYELTQRASATPPTIAASDKS